MARHKRGRMALYEVMSKARDKPGYGRTMDKIREQRDPEAHVDEEVEQEQALEAEASKIVEVKPKKVEEPVIDAPVQQFEVEEDVDEAVGQRAVRWWRKPRIAQINAGRIEFSMPYQLAIAILLGLVLLVLAAFQLGQRYYMATSGTESVGPVAVVAEQGTRPLVNQDEGNVRAQYNLSGASNTTEESGQSSVASTPRTTRPPVSTGSNAIILVQYGKTADLEPVKEHFAKAGISTEIVPRAGRYFLRTTDRFESSSDAAEALKKIKTVGAKYKAPAGYETFASNLFQDAYLMKVE